MNEEPASVDFSRQAPPGNTAAFGPLEAAFAALRTYDAGSGRATLCPIDEEVRRVLPDVAGRANLERRLILVLQAKPSFASSEYICSKLAVLGSDQSVAVLASLLPDPRASTAARNALEKLPGPAASKALRRSLSSLEGRQKVGAIQSLGARRDRGSVGILARLLRQPEGEMAAAAAFSLGQIGSVRAGGVLTDFLPKAPAAVRPRIVDATLVCAERLLAERQNAAAQRLYEVLAGQGEAAHVREGALRGLTRCRSRS
jgi:HEAT repeat protein